MGVVEAGGLGKTVRAGKADRDWGSGETGKIGGVGKACWAHGVG